MAVADVHDWMNAAHQPGSTWYAKRLSGNDTLANESHQAGPYFPKSLLFSLYPQLGDKARQNPDQQLSASIESHAITRPVRAIWYNNKYFGGTRDEARVTGWGGRESPVLDPDATGALTVFCFSQVAGVTSTQVRIWVCRTLAEEELIEERVGPVEPGRPVIWSPDGSSRLSSGQIANSQSPCYLPPDRLLPEWRTAFPPAIDVIQKVLELRPLAGKSPDYRLLKRRDCEYELFRSIEDAVEGSVIKKGFESVADFLTHAQRILQRRKARSGKSFELHVRAILLEEGLRSDVDFSHNPESEVGKTPDYLFPSERAYKDPEFPTEKLRMLAVKTTCRDRWRQILNEADRITIKHLLTLQEGVSLSQYREMENAGVRLVVPEALAAMYPSSVQPKLTTFGEFIRGVRR